MRHITPNQLAWLDQSHQALSGTRLGYDETVAVPLLVTVAAYLAA
ncbi:hypothetical protein AB0M28_19485 [Streptomyces sp. NPDC051940]